MEVDIKNYLPIGEFARLSGIKRKNLIFYDEIGLFSPEITKENGYRYYSYRQLDTVNVIYAMKEIGMPLKDIKIYLNKRTPDDLVQLFSEQKKLIDQEIQKLKRISSMMQTRMILTKESSHISVDKIVVKQCDEEWIILSSAVADEEKDSQWDTLLEFYNYCPLNDISCGYPIGAIVSSENLIKENWGQRSYFFTKINKKLKLSTMAVKPQGLYVIGYTLGPYDMVEPLYKRLSSYIAEKGLRIIGNSYEESLLDEVAVKNPEEYLTQISIMVEEV